MKRVYLSLPISGYDIEERKAYAAKRKQDLLTIYKHIQEDIKYEIVTPFEVCPDTDKPYSYYIGRDIEALLNCDEIFMCQGWEESKGCQLEIQAAKIYGKKVRELEDWNVDSLLNYFKNVPQIKI